MHENKIDTSDELKKSKLLYLALLSENEALRVSLKREQAEVIYLKSYLNTLDKQIRSLESTVISMQSSISMMSVPYQRYMKLVALMPKSLKNIIKKIVLLGK